jgi:hypothetical protein
MRFKVKLVPIITADTKAWRAVRREQLRVLSFCYAFRVSRGREDAWLL